MRPTNLPNKTSFQLVKNLRIINFSSDICLTDLYFLSLTRPLGFIFLQIIILILSLKIYMHYIVEY